MSQQPYDPMSEATVELTKRQAAGGNAPNPFGPSDPSDSSDETVLNLGRVHGQDLYGTPTLPLASPAPPYPASAYPVMDAPVMDAPVGPGPGYGYPVPDYVPPPYGAAYGQVRRSNGAAIAGIVLGVIALLLCLIPLVNLFGAVLGLIGLICGIVGWASAGRRGSGRGLAIAAVVLSVVASVGVVVSWIVVGAWVDSFDEMNDLASGQATEQILAEDLRVDIGTFTGTESSYGVVTSRLPVTVTSTATDDHSYTIEITARAADGTVIDEDTDWITLLEPGDSEVVSMFEYADADDLDALRTATFEITSVGQY